MDIGFGAKSLSFITAQAMIDSGYLPDVISSDIYQMSIHGPLLHFPACLSKFLALGVCLADVIWAATVRPGQKMGIAGQIRTLGTGTLVDYAQIQLLQGMFSLYDEYMNRRDGTQLLLNTLTIVNGRELVRQPDGVTAP